jgi:hypothetical protein
LGPETITVRNAPDRRRYELIDRTAVIGKAHYLAHDGGNGPERIFYHTTVSEDYSGQGLAPAWCSRRSTTPWPPESPSSPSAPTSRRACGNTRTASSARPPSGPSTSPPSKTPSSNNNATGQRPCPPRRAAPSSPAGRPKVYLRESGSSSPMCPGAFAARTRWTNAANSSM